METDITDTEKGEVTLGISPTRNPVLVQKISRHRVALLKDNAIFNV